LPKHKKVSYRKPITHRIYLTPGLITMRNLVAVCHTGYCARM